MFATVLAMHVLVISIIVKSSRQNLSAPVVVASIGTLDLSPGSDAASIGNAALPARRRPLALRVSPARGSGQRALTPAGHLIPPRADESYTVDPAPYARQAGLRSGRGATIVMRLLVLPSGRVGDIEIDVSSGSALIDNAAMDYARARHWLTGTADGEPTTLWIRWGVRLQG
jgi:TonB family protein